MIKAVEMCSPGSTYAETLIELGERDRRVVVLEADLMKASGSEPFKGRFPERHFNLGIAEQNLLGVAAGFAAMGKIPFASTFACFASQRACDQANAVSYNRFNVKIVGSYAGLSSGKNGGTHISVEDMAIFRAMPNMTILDPGDCCELADAIRAAWAHEGPVYVRMAKGPMPRIFPCDHKCEIGKSVVLQEGGDIALITTGIATWEGMSACKELGRRGIRVLHIHMPSIKPIDSNSIVAAAKKAGGIVTVENHSRIGGLGSAVAEVVCEKYPVPVTRLGLDDCFGETGDLTYLMDRFGISSPHIVGAVETCLSEKKAAKRSNTTR